VRDQGKHRDQKQPYPKQEVSREFRRFDLFLIHRSLSFLGVRRAFFDVATAFIAGPTTPLAADGFGS
jgi:hypothetical protein